MPEVPLRTEFNSILTTLDIDSHFDLFGGVDRQRIEDALWNLFENSDTARGLLRKVPGLLGDNPFPINFVEDDFFVAVKILDTGGFEPLSMNIDLGFGDPDRVGNAEKGWFIDQNGNATFSSLERSLIHEFIHAVERLYDPDLDEKPLGAAGDTIDLTNIVMQEMGETSVRISYAGSTSYADIQPVGYAFTFGETVHTAHVLNPGSGLVNIDMTGDDSVAGTERDLIVAHGNIANSIQTGDGRDLSMQAMVTTPL